MKQYSITFCTVSMNRLHHLKETVPANLRDNADYPGARFVLLDYNSGDGMEGWVNSELQEHIQSGRLVYYRTDEPEFFNRSHSRNLSFNLAESELICNVDADNFTGPGFAAYLNEVFNRDTNCIVNFDYREETEAYKDAFGRVCVRREDFHAVGGYDESMSSYGYEDMDLYGRLVKLGRREEKIDSFDFLRSIAHSDHDRFSKEYFVNKLSGYYVMYGIGMNKVLFLYNDGSFETGTLRDDEQFYQGLHTIHEGDWLRGQWQESDGLLRLYFLSDEIRELRSTNGGLSYNLNDEEGWKTFFRIEDRRFLDKVKAQYSIVTNVSRYKQNIIRQRVRVNEAGYGKGHVYRNFSADPLWVQEPQETQVIRP